jgi:hypothetical protein
MDIDRRMISSMYVQDCLRVGKSVVLKLIRANDAFEATGQADKHAGVVVEETTSDLSTFSSLSSSNVTTMRTRRNMKNKEDVSLFDLKKNSFFIIQYFLSY